MIFFFVWVWLLFCAVWSLSDPYFRLLPLHLSPFNVRSLVHVVRVFITRLSSHFGVYSILFSFSFSSIFIQLHLFVLCFSDLSAKLILFDVTSINSNRWSRIIHICRIVPFIWYSWHYDDDNHCCVWRIFSGKENSNLLQSSTKLFISVLLLYSLMPQSVW